MLLQSIAAALMKKANYHLTNEAARNSAASAALRQSIVRCYSWKALDLQKQKAEEDSEYISGAYLLRSYATGRYPSPSEW